MKNVTEKTQVAGVVSVWAIPQQVWRDDEYVFTGEFEYELRAQDNTPYQKGAIKLATETVIVGVPAGINLIEATVATIQEEIVKVRAETHEKIAKLEKHLSELLMVTYQPEEVHGNHK